MTEEIHQAVRQHQQAVFRRIRLPILGVVFGLILMAILLFVGWATDNITAQQVSCVAAGLAVIFLLIPMVLILLVINFLTVFLAFGSGALVELAKPPLATAREYSAKGASMTQTASEKLTQPVIYWRTRVAFWRTLTLKSVGLEDIGKEDGQTESEN